MATVKIVQICATARFAEMDTIYGLGEDNKVYIWTTTGWDLYV